MIIRKLDHEGREIWSYSGTVLEETEQGVVIEAFFQRDLVSVDSLHFERGDRMVESFFSDRWFNIFEVFKSDSTVRKGWYCNIARPAQFVGDEILQVDLAIDLIVYPDWSTVVLDMDEFEALALDQEDRKAAMNGLASLEELVRQQKPPFDPQEPPAAVA